ncbi:MAG: hypothetical protein ACW99U_02765 [Candidatus Thorarchaeota archaeon]|jgi:hypothetical protein
MDWGEPIDAKGTLRAHLETTWFGAHIRLLYKLKSDYSLDELVRSLGEHIRYPVEAGMNMKRLKILVQLLELAGVVERDDTGIFRIHAATVDVRETTATGRPDFTEALAEDHDLVQFVLNEGTFLVSRDALVKFVVETGRRISKKSFSLK